MKKLISDSLESEKNQLVKLLSDAETTDPLGALSLKSRLDSIDHELEIIQTRDQNQASIAMLFYGKPVLGSHGIDAEFASKAIQEYQAALSKHMVSVSGGNLGSRGPIPEHNLSKLNIVDVVHGSFGFHLEEASDGNDELFHTALKLSVDQITQFLKGMTAEKKSLFEDVMARIDTRTFVSIKSLLSLVYREGASFKILDETEEHNFDVTKIYRAYERLQSVELAEEEITLVGTLIGVVPFGRRFEFKSAETGDIIAGVVGEKFSADYLERFQSDEDYYTGRNWRAIFIKRVIKKPGQAEKENYTLIDLLEKKI